MKNQKRLPIGVTDFSEVIEENYYYIDKTSLMEEILKDGAKVTLFTRPRRFGKTLNMSMLKYFFDIENKDKNKKLFKNLYIEKSSAFEKQGEYPVIYISLKDFKGESWEDTFKAIKHLIGNLYNKFEFVQKVLNEKDKIVFNKIWFEEDEAEYINALKLLSYFLEKYYSRKVIILIDEYDTPLISAYDYKYYNEAIKFFRTFFSSALKDNEHLQMGVMTGILRVAKEGMFSGLNNLKVNSILNESYSSYFGLKEKEVEEMLEYYEMQYKESEVKDWYNGYKFGNSQVYNPWSVINYISEKKLKPYWINTSSDVLIKKILTEGANREETLFEDLEKLFNGENIIKFISEEADFSSLSEIEKIWQLFLFSGYLTVEKEVKINSYEIKIPNREVYSFFKEIFIDNFLGNTAKFLNLVDYLDEENQEGITKFEEKVQEILLNTVSFYDLEKEKEKYYHINKYGYILEFKVTDSKDKLESKCKEAIEQIINKKYSVSLKEKGISKIRALGICFYGKEIKILSKEI